MYSRPLTDLVLLAYGPKSVLETPLRDIPRIDTACLFGSWAARYEGEQGPPPNDIDLLVVGSPDRDQVHEGAEGAAATLRRDVQVVFRSAQSWQESTDAFATTVRSRPLVELDLSGGPE